MLLRLEGSRMKSRYISKLVASKVLVLTLATTAFSEDWAQYRGPSRNAKSRENNLLESWPEDGPPLAWKVS